MNKGVSLWSPKHWPKLTEILEIGFSTIGNKRQIDDTRLIDFK